MYNSISTHTLCISFTVRYFSCSKKQVETGEVDFTLLQEMKEKERDEGIPMSPRARLRWAARKAFAVSQTTFAVSQVMLIFHRRCLKPQKSSSLQPISEHLSCYWSCGSPSRLGMSLLIKNKYPIYYV